MTKSSFVRNHEQANQVLSQMKVNERDVSIKFLDDETIQVSSSGGESCMSVSHIHDFGSEPEELNFG